MEDAYFQIETIDNDTMAVVVIYRFERKVVVDLYYLQRLTNIGPRIRVGIMWVGPALEEPSEPPRLMSWHESRWEALKQLKRTYTLGRLMQQ